MFILKTTHSIVTDELKDRIRWLEAELARQHSENRDMVNALATQNRAATPFPKDRPQFKRRAPALSVYQLTKKLERSRMSDDERDYPKEFKSE
jgi:hypothetical protein